MNESDHLGLDQPQDRSSTTSQTVHPAPATKITAR